MLMSSEADAEAPTTAIPAGLITDETARSITVAVCTAAVSAVVLMVAVSVVGSVVIVMWSMVAMDAIARMYPVPIVTTVMSAVMAAVIAAAVALSLRLGDTHKHHRADGQQQKSESCHNQFSGEQKQTRSCQSGCFRDIDELKSGGCLNIRFDEKAD